MLQLLSLSQPRVTQVPHFLEFMDLFNLILPKLQNHILTYDTTLLVCYGNYFQLIFYMCTVYGTDIKQLLPKKPPYSFWSPFSSACKSKAL
jgi:hypothetical protein